ncbi:transporter substrate-binding domain-containing protein, partial [Klebsiella pneumoniae]|uniref:transporter substrate-binding domain-containing protein n=1 Tax=Klebsiella pneumoniae TaxID=573 RepID=UPI00272F329A
IPFQWILPVLYCKRFDFVATSLTITRDREGKFSFSAPFSVASVAILIRFGDSRIISATDLQGIFFACHAGAPHIAVLKV